MIRIVCLSFITAVLAGCGFQLGGEQDGQASQEALVAQVEREAALIYDDIAAFCLAHIQGASQSVRLTNAGFSGRGSSFERTWELGNNEAGLRVRTRSGQRLSPRGCSVDTQYSTSYVALPDTINSGIQAGWATYLRSQGFRISEEERDAIAIVTKDGDEIVSLGIGGGMIRLATRGDLQIKLSSYSNGVRTQELMEVYSP